MTTFLKLCFAFFKAQKAQHLFKNQNQLGKTLSSLLVFDNL